MPAGLVRFQKAGCFHFITFSCYRRLPLLARSDGYSIFERELEKVRRRYEFVVAGYVLMPEHVHLLVNEPRVSSLATALQVLKQQTSKQLKLTTSSFGKGGITISTSTSRRKRPRSCGTCTGIL